MHGRVSMWSRPTTTIGVTAELPGLKQRDVEVLLQDGVLPLRGEKRIENESGNKTYSERYYGRFERQIALDATSMRAPFTRRSAMVC